VFGHDAAASNAIAATAWASSNQALRARVRVPGEGWLRTVRLGAATADNPSIAVNARGGVAVAWMEYRGDEELLRVARRPAGAGWTRPKTLYRGTPAFGTDAPDVSIGPLGKSTVAISISRRFHVNPPRPLAFTFADGRWSRAVELTSRPSHSVRVVTGPKGRVTAAWVTNRGARCTAHGSGSSWTRPICRDKPGSLGLELAVDAAGRVYLMNGVGIWSAAPGARWQREPVPGGDLDAFDQFSFSIDAAAPGRAVAAWSQGVQTGRDTIDWTMYASVRRSDGTWTRRAHLANRPDPSAAISGEGTAFVAWSGDAGIRVARKVTGHQWSDPPAIVGQPESYAPRLAANRNGDALLVFRRPITRPSVWAAWRP
jgi:hypothetical protein